MAKNEVRIRVSAKDQASKKFGTIAKAIGGLIVAYAGVKTIRMLKNAADAFVNYGLQIDKITKLTGLAAESMQKLKYAAEQEHASLESLEKGLMNLTVRLGYAGDELETYVRYFRELGIEYRETDGTLRDTYDVFLDISDAVSQGELSTEQLSATLQLFGARAGKELIPLLKKGRNWFELMGDEAERLGVILDEETIKKIKEFDDAMLKMRTGIKGISYQLFVPLINVASEFANHMSKTFEFNKTQIREFGETMANVIVQLAQFLSLAIPEIIAGWTGMGIAALELNKILVKYNPFRVLFPGDKEKVLGDIQETIDLMWQFSTPFLDAGEKIEKFWKDFREGLKEIKEDIKSEPPFKPIIDNLDELGEALDKTKIRFWDMWEAAHESIDIYLESNLALKKWKEGFENNMENVEDITERTVTNMIYAFQNFGHNLKDVFEDAETDIGDFIKILLSLGSQIASIFPGGGLLSALIGFPTLFFNKGGLVPAFQHGGYVLGPGGTDKILARLTAKEFVVNQEATAKNRELLEHINKGGDVSYNNSYDSTYNINLNSVSPAYDVNQLEDELHKLDNRRKLKFLRG